MISNSSDQVSHAGVFNLVFFSHSQHFDENRLSIKVNYEYICSTRDHNKFSARSCLDRALAELDCHSPSNVATKS